MDRTKSAETDFFHAIAPAVIELVKKGRKRISIAEDKNGSGDYSTNVDVETEKLIVSELRERFPADHVLAEEEHSDTAIPPGRIWLIDPICGTNNMGKGIMNFCTNIALADKGEVIAACVIDHSQGDYFWSVGGGKVNVNHDGAYVPPDRGLGRKVDIDFGSVRNVSKELRLQHNRFLARLVEETDLDIVSLNTSLGFAYTAIGKLDGFINSFNHPWDIAAAAFLVRQAGGMVTGMDGTDWTVTTVGAIGGHTPRVHQQLLDLFLESSAP
jgi:myo-inositol-1(or 4)-monophosphatase